MVLSRNAGAGTERKEADRPTGVPCLLQHSRRRLVVGEVGCRLMRNGSKIVMIEKPSARSTMGDGGCGQAWDVATRGRATVGSAGLDRAVLAAPSGATEARSNRLGRSLVAAETSAADEGVSGSTHRHAATTIATQRVGRGRGGGHSTRVARQRCRALPDGANDWTHSAATRNPGWSPASTSAAAAQRLACPGRGRSRSRVGLVRHHRRTGNSRRSAPDNSHRNLAAGRTSSHLATHLDHRDQRAGVLDRTLASLRTAGLRAVRQRQSLHGTTPIPRRRGPSHSPLPEPRSHTRLRTSQRNRFPSRHRELQRTLASQGLATLRASQPGATAATLQRLSRGAAPTPSHSHQRGTAPSSVPVAVAAQISKLRSEDASSSSAAQPTPVTQQFWGTRTSSIANGHTDWSVPKSILITVVSNSSPSAVDNTTTNHYSKPSNTSSLKNISPNNQQPDLKVVSLANHATFH